MKRRPSPQSELWLPSMTQVLAALVLVGGLTLFAIRLTSGPWADEQAPFPYVWRDIAIVQLLCGLPLAWMLADVIHRQVSATAAIVLAGIFFGVSLVPLLAAVRTSVRTELLAHPSLGIVLRVIPALGFGVAVVLLVMVLHGGLRTQGERRWSYAVVFVLAVVALLLPPWTYVNARIRHDIARLGEFLGQKRFGEAHTLAQGLLVLDGSREWRGLSLTKLAAAIEDEVRSLEAHVALPLPRSAPAAAWLERARQLAMLGRTDAALEALPSVRDAEVETLRATILETRSEWSASLASYRIAKETWEAKSASSARTAGLVQTTTGIAYCQRKMGRNTEAEAAYQEVLTLAPTADSHFLLAQFYEDTQQTEKAREHARHAIALAPDQYREQGERLISKLSVSHFGCLGVYSDERDPSRPSLAR